MPLLITAKRQIYRHFVSSVHQFNRHFLRAINLLHRGENRDFPHTPLDLNRTVLRRQGPAKLIHTLGAPWQSGSDRLKVLVRKEVVSDVAIDPERPRCKPVDAGPRPAGETQRAVVSLGPRSEVKDQINAQAGIWTRRLSGRRRRHLSANGAVSPVPIWQSSCRWASLGRSVNI